MSAKAIIVCTENNISYSSGVYLKWHGHRALEIIRLAETRMRKNDSYYSIARICGIAHEEIAGNLSLGILPPPQNNESWAHYSAGDYGVFIVNVCTGIVSCYDYNGYHEKIAILKKIPE